jgi:hypothetical protein
LGWLSEYSEAALRSALGAAGGGLDGLPIELTGTNDLTRPTWASGSATIDRRFLAKFGFSEPTAVWVWHEARVLEMLERDPAFDVPELVAASPSPACLVAPIIDGGVPLSYQLVCALMPERVGALGAELARFLAELHAPEILALACERLDEPLRAPEPGLQATTDELRLRFTAMIGSRERARVHRWCDWVGQELANPAEVYVSLTDRRLSLERIVALHIGTTSAMPYGARKRACRSSSRCPAAAPQTTTSATSPSVSRSWASNPELSPRVVARLRFRHSTTRRVLSLGERYPSSRPVLWRLGATRRRQPESDDTPACTETTGRVAGGREP